MVPCRGLGGPEGFREGWSSKLGSGGIRQQFSERSGRSYMVFGVWSGGAINSLE